MGPLPPSLVSWLTSSMLVLRPAAAGQALGQLGDRRQPQIFLRALALVHDVEDFIHKAVQADKGGHLAARLTAARSWERCAHAEVVMVWESGQLIGSDV